MTIRPDYGNELEYRNISNKEEKKIWALTFKGALSKVRPYLKKGWVVKKRVTSAHIGYTCVLTRRK